MSDPVAEAAANLAKQQSDPNLLEKAMDTIHDLEAKVEHLIHPETEAGSPAAGELQNPAAGAAANSEAVQTTSDVSSAAPSTSTLATGSTGSESPNVVAAAVAGGPEAGAVAAAGDELPNAVSGAAESTTVTASATSASGSGEISSTGGSSDKPAHVRIAAHLEAIYTIATEAPNAAAADTSTLKTHVGDILHRISNGMQVTEGELVQKLEALYRML